jgi:hypothetical protein
MPKTAWAWALSSASCVSRRARAWPGRRFVQMAQLFGARGYLYSICNADWSPAMTDLAAMIPLKSDD